MNVTSSIFDHCLKHPQMLLHHGSYAAVPVGKDTLQSKLNNMCKQAGIGGNNTNHSLRAASATQMYDSGVPEKLIQERTGHRSLEALRMYERTNAQQHQAISAVLSASHSESTLYHQASEKRILVFLTLFLKYNQLSLLHHHLIFKTFMGVLST